MNKILIDTNIYSHALRGNSDIVSTLRQVAQISICAISIGELLSGFKGGFREVENRRELGQFLDSPRVSIISVDEDTAEFYSTIITGLKQKGTPIPTNDIWIAAVAFQYGLQMYSLDKHFQFIEGLLLR